MTRSLYRFTFMPQITRSARRWAALSLCLMSFAATHASASVTLLGNRVIYPAEAREKTLQFTNDDGTPALMQIWLDINNPKSTPENADAPFVASPQIFRMNPHSGQMVRLSFVGQPLPRDRESLFYLNFLQVPAVRQTDSDKNKLLLVVTNRLKVFYRPAGLAGDANHVIDRLSLRQAGNAARRQPDRLLRQRQPGRDPERREAHRHPAGGSDPAVFAGQLAGERGGAAGRTARHQ